MRPQVVILAAGLGTRLGRPIPKALTELSDGRSIIDQQLSSIRSYLPDAQVYVVVGYKYELLMEAHPDLLFVYNEAYDRTNTSKSLLRALEVSNHGGVLWLNGDVVFDPSVMERVRAGMLEDRTFVVVDRSEVGAEEVKYCLDARGHVSALSKTVTDPVGEAVGVNYVASGDKADFVRRLAEVDDDDYFERGLELMIEHDGTEISPVDITDLYAVEVDDDADLALANRYQGGSPRPAP